MTKRTASQQHASRGEFPEVPDRWIRKPELCHILGDISPTTLERKIRSGEIPKPKKIFGNTSLQAHSGWLLSEIMALLASRKTAGAE